MTNNTTFSGNVSIGTDVVSSQKLKIGGTGCMIIPKGTTPQRPTAVTGKIRFNTTTHKFEGRISDWHPISDEDAPPLYSFSSHTFTNAGVTGRSGPTIAQLRSAYASESWEQDTDLFNELGQNGGAGFTNINGMQLWTIPQTGTYRIRASGAKGGDADKQNGTTRPGGQGAYAQGDFTLTQGRKLHIVVGQAGGTSTGSAGGGGGGGGSWVLEGTHLVDANNLGTQYYLSNVFVVGGGGGGCHGINNIANVTGGNAVASQASVNATAGGAKNSSYNAGGGAGLANSGAGGNQSGGRGLYSGALGGLRENGYNSTYDGGEGGYGGGGANTAHIAGGGAGYGGGASNSLTVPGALGGTCRSNGNSVSFANHSSTHGSVIITKL
jgi:hypothetical protein